MRQTYQERMMGHILDTIEQFLTVDGWSIHRLDDREVIKSVYEGKNGSFTCFAQEIAKHEQFVFYTVFPVRSSQATRTAVAEFITRANYGMIVGNFEMDYSDGEVRYKTSLDFEHVVITAPMLQHVIYLNVLTMDRYFPGLMRVLYAGIIPQQAIEEVEEEARTR